MKEGARWEQEQHGSIHYKVGQWKVFVDIEIERVSDGKCVVYKCETPWPADNDTDVSGPVFMFALGNYSCDCNQHMFFERALGENFVNLDTECSHSKYRIVGPEWLVQAIKDEGGNP
jgi:hypothetical protein